MSIDLVEKSYDDRYFRSWETTRDLENIFINIYISEKYKKDLYLIPFVNILIEYGKNTSKIPLLYDYNVKFDKDLQVISNIITEYSFENSNPYKDLYKNTDKRFVYYPINLIDYDYNNVYLVFFLYDRMYNEVNFFDTMDFKMNSYKKYFEKFFQDIHGKNVKVLYNTKMLNKLGNLDYDNCIIFSSIADRCVIRAFWYLEARLKNSNSELNNYDILKGVLSKVTLDPKRLCLILGKYGQYIYKITDDYEIKKVNKKYILEISKKKLSVPRYKNRLLTILAGLVATGISYKLIYTKKDYKK